MTTGHKKAQKRELIEPHAGDKHTSDEMTRDSFMRATT